MATLRKISAAETRLIKGCGHEPRGKFHSLQEFVLRHGRSFNRMPIASHKHRGLPRQCFLNCFNLMSERPDKFIYCEGYLKFHFAIYHAWIITKEGKLIEPTLPKRAEEYFGIPLKYEFVWETVQKTGRTGIIDCPELKFPILTRPVQDWLHE